MNWVDIVVLGDHRRFRRCSAFMRGFVREVLGIGAWIGAGVVALWALPGLRAALPAMDRQCRTGPIALAFAAVFLVTLFLLSMVAGLIGGLVRGSALGGVDRTLGIAVRHGEGRLAGDVAYIGAAW